MLTKSSSTARPRKPSSTVRNPSTIHITRRRSSRSTSAPLTNEKSSHGSCCAKEIPATRIGSRVREAASSGPATSVTPSPRFDTVLADHSFVYSGPRPLLAKLHTSPSPFRRHSRRRVYARWHYSELQRVNTSAIRAISPQPSARTIGVLPRRAGSDLCAARVEWPHEGNRGRLRPHGNDFAEGGAREVGLRPELQPE